MPKVVLPLVYEYNTRGLFATTGKDSRLVNGFYVPVQDRAKNQATWYVEKRPGWVSDSSTGTSLSGLYITETLAAYVSSYLVAGADNSVIFRGTVNCGTTTGVVNSMLPFTWGATSYVMLGANSGAGSGAIGWYLGENASTINLTFTGSITSGQKTISGVASTTGVYVGQLLTQAALTAGTRIASISGTDVITDTNAISTTAAATITKQPVSRIIDADFPAPEVLMYAELDGYVFSSDTNNRRIYNSDLNAVHSWGASNYITVDSAIGEFRALTRYKNYIVAFCEDGIQFFYNAGNTSGSPLSKVPQGTITGIGGAYQMISGTILLVSTLDNVYWYWNNAIYCFDGLSPKKISTPDIDNILAQRTINGPHQGPFPYEMGFLYVGGKHLIYVSYAATDLQLFYDIETDKWTEAGFASGYRVNGIHGVSTGGRGVDYVISKTSYQDASTTYTLTVQTPRFNFGTNNRKRIKKVSLIADNQASGSAYLSWSTDDYATFSTTRTLDMTANEKSARNFGVGRNWAFRVIHYDNTAFRAEGLEIEYDELDN